MHGSTAVDCLGDLGKLRNPIAVGIAAPPEAAAAEEGVDLDLLRREAEHLGRDIGVDAVHLAAGPDLGAVGAQLHDAVDRLHRRVREIGKRELGLEHLRGSGEGERRHLHAARRRAPRPWRAARYSSSISDVERAPPRSCPTSTLKAFRPAMADHVSVASTATPEGICTTSTTPGIDLAYLSSMERTFAPK